MSDDRLPPALREVLDAEGDHRDWVIESPLWAKVKADRARAMLAALRWAETLPPHDKKCTRCLTERAAIAALEQEARDE